MATIPFLYSNSKKDNEKGAKLSLFANRNTDETYGEYYLSASGFWLAGLANGSGDFSGVEIAGMFNMVDGDSKGVEIAGIFNSLHRNFKGVQIAGFFNLAGRIKGFSYGTIMNYAEKNNGLAIQIGTINFIRDYNPKGTVIQIGLYNRAGEQSIPLLNIRRKEKNKLEKKLE